MRFRRRLDAVLGVAALLAGMIRVVWAQTDPSTSADSTCSYADCPCVSCYQTGTDPNGYNLCAAQDDYTFAANYTCTPQVTWTCVQSDYGPCFDDQTCGPSLNSCGYRWTSWCACNASWNGPCTTTTYDSYDNCDSEPPNS